MLIAKMNPGKDGDEARSGEGRDPGPEAWPAPTADAPLDAGLSLPGSKSLTGRELVLSALADGPGRLEAPLHSRDSELMIDALRAFGTEIVAAQGQQDRPFGPDLRVTPAAELTGSTTIACGLAGTVMRFVPPVAALALGPVAFDGDPYARKRPMRPVLEALRALGADIADEGRGALPFTVHGTGSLRGGRVELDASSSSQFVSALLLSGARFDAGVHVVHTGARLPSTPHIEMTLEVLRAHGVAASAPAPGEWRVEPGPIAARTVRIEPDLSNAAPFLAAAVATGGSVTIHDWPESTTQVGDRLRTLLTVFGASVEKNGDGSLTVTGRGLPRAVELHVPEAGELAPTLVGLAALVAHAAAADAPGADASAPVVADGSAGASSRITGIGHIRHHETDRIAALVAEINALGGRAEELDDGIAIHPARLHGGLWRAYDDHRMATTGALIGLRVPEIRVDDISSTAKTLPQFPELWARMIGRPGDGPSGLSAHGVTGEEGSAAGGLLTGMPPFSTLPLGDL